MLLFSLGSACGPIEYVNQVTRKASSEVAAARAVKADKFAPYYFTLAVEYLHKAREEASFADYQAANHFGHRSEEAAQKAKKLAVERAARGEEPFKPPTEEQLAPLAPERDETVAPLKSGEDNEIPSGLEDKKPEKEKKGDGGAK